MPGSPDRTSRARCSAAPQASSGSRASIRPGTGTRQFSMRTDHSPLIRRTSLPATLLLIGLAGCGGEAARSDGTADDTTSAATDTPGTELAYVTNEGSGELTILDTSNDSVVGTIPVGTRPRGIRLSEDGRTVFVALSG